MRDAIGFQAASKSSVHVEDLLHWSSAGLRLLPLAYVADDKGPANFSARSHMSQPLVVDHQPYTTTAKPSDPKEVS